MSNKYDGMIAHAKTKSEIRQEEVLAEIKHMIKRGEKISFYSVMKATGASKSFLYNNEVVANKIRAYRDTTETPRTASSDKAIISAQKAEIKKLKEIIAMMQRENSSTYRDKYEAILAENKELKKQLESAYSNW